MLPVVVVVVALRRGDGRWTRKRRGRKCRKTSGLLLAPAALLSPRLGRAASPEAGERGESRGHSGSGGVGGSEPITYYNCLARRARASARQASIIATNGPAANNIRRHRQLSAAAAATALPPLAPAGGYLFVLILRPTKEAQGRRAQLFFPFFSRAARI